MDIRFTLTSVNTAITLGKSVRTQSPWLTIFNNFDNVPHSDLEDLGTFFEFFNGY